MNAFSKVLSIFTILNLVAPCAFAGKRTETGEDVRKMVFNNSRPIRQCFEALANKYPNADVQITWTNRVNVGKGLKPKSITRPKQSKSFKAKVTGAKSAQTPRPSLKDADVDKFYNCYEKLVKTWVFPEETKNKIVLIPMDAIAKGSPSGNQPEMDASTKILNSKGKTVTNKPLKKSGVFEKSKYRRATTIVPGDPTIN